MSKMQEVSSTSLTGNQKILKSNLDTLMARNKDAIKDIYLQNVLRSGAGAIFINVTTANVDVIFMPLEQIAVRFYEMAEEVAKKMDSLDQSQHLFCIVCYNDAGSIIITETYDK